MTAEKKVSIKRRNTQTIGFNSLEYGEIKRLAYKAGLGMRQFILIKVRSK